MSDTHIWNVQIAGQVVGGISPSSEFLVGPFNPGETVLVTNLVATNEGSMAGMVYIALYAYPGANEQMIYSDSATIEPGQTHAFPISVTTPAISGQWPLGIKVWGTSESEPSFTLGAKLGLPSVVLPVIALAGLLGISYFLAK